MSIQTAWQATLDFWDELPIIVEPSRAELTSDALLLPLRQFDEQIGLTRQFAQDDNSKVPGLPSGGKGALFLESALGAKVPASLYDKACQLLF